MTDELDEILDTEPGDIRLELRRLGRAIVRGENLEARLALLGRLIAQNQSLADLFARRRLILELERATGKRIRGETDSRLVSFARSPMSADAISPRVFAAWLPSVGFGEAVRSILSRFPVIAPGWQKTRDAYEAGAFALARSASLHITEHIQKTIAGAIENGTPIEIAQQDITAALAHDRGDDYQAGYIDAYADTVFRTVTTGAYASGRRDQARDPEVRPFIGAWRFAATRDSDVRPNHLAADGFIAAIDDPVWRELTPPLGYNCRCALEIVSRDEAIRRGIAGPDGSFLPRALPPGAGPDPGFRNLDLAALG